MTFEQENDALLQDILQEKFYNGFQNPEANSNKNLLELNITASCNQKCEYCYLVKHGKELYPAEIRNEDQIIHHLKLLIHYYLDHNIHPDRIDMFSGEIWGTGFANQIFDTVLWGIDNGWKITYIMIPSNMSFIMSTKKTNIIEKYIQKFMERNCKLVFSASVDGLLLEEETRSFINEEQNILKESGGFYDKLFQWCKKYKFAFHPMISAYGIEKWMDNYKWWQYMFAKYHLNPFEYGMYLEVRNDEWTIDKINHYVEFLNYMIDYDFNELLGSDLSNFITEVIVVGTNKKGYFPYVLLNEGNTYNCSVDTSLIVRLGDLAIGPCHRTHYDKFIYGKYRVEHDSITGVQANNIQLANAILFGSTKLLMKCDKCPISYHCIRGCLGAQYESTGEILQPCDTVCHLLKARLIFLYLKYKKMGVFDWVYHSDDLQRKSFLKKLENTCLKLRKGEPNLWNYWEMKTSMTIS